MTDQRLAILQAMYLNRNTTIIQIRNIVQKQFPQCSHPHVQAAMREHKIQRRRIHSNYYHWDIPSQVESEIRASLASVEAFVRPEKVNKVWTPELKTSLAGEALRRNADRLMLHSK